MYEDGEETEFEKPELEEEDPEPETVSFTIPYKKLMIKMIKMYPNKFDNSSGVTLTAAHLHYKYRSSTPKLIIDPTLIPGSFFDTPTWANEEANTGVWPLQTWYPRGRRRTEQVTR